MLVIQSICCFSAKNGEIRMRVGRAEESFSVLDGEVEEEIVIKTKLISCLLSDSVYSTCFLPRGLSRSIETDQLERWIMELCIY